jgi:beta-1,4-mannosyltransferase
VRENPRNTAKSDLSEAHAASPISIIGIPIGPDAYTACYYAALRKCGVTVIAGDLSGRWLVAQRGRAKYLHLNWPSFHYQSRSAIASLAKFSRFVALLVLARLCGLRILWTAHNLYPHDDNVVPGLDWLGRRIVVLLSHRVFAHGKFAAETVAREFHGVARKLTVIPHGHWMDYYANTISRGAARSQLGIPISQTVFLLIGLCKQYKNLELLISTFQGASLDNSALWIVGRFPDSEYFARVTAQQARLANGIHIEPRFIPDDDLQLYLKSCSVVVLPYADILTSGSAMLAIGFGRPVVAPDIGHLRDVINSNCGVLYDPAEPEGLSRAMRLAKDRNFDEMQIQNHARAYTWHDAAMTSIRAISDC